MCVSVGVGVGSTIHLIKWILESGRKRVLTVLFRLLLVVHAWCGTSLQRVGLTLDLV